MMNKTKSARVHLIRFLFLLPLLVVILLAFRNTTQERNQPLKEKQVVTDTIPVAPKTPAAWKDINTIDITDELIATVRLKNGNTEKYDLKIIKEKEAFEKKYGPMPEPPTPPVPLTHGDKELPEAPEAPEKPEMPEAPERPEATERPEAPERPEAAERPEAPEKPERAELPEKGDGWGVIAALDRGRIHTWRRIGAPNAPEAPEAPKAPEKALYSINLQDCLNEKGYCITVADNNGECVVIIKDKNNKIVEAVTLVDWQKDKKYEEKYGDIPPRKIVLMSKTKTGQPVNTKPIRVEADKEVVVIAKTDPKIAIVSKVAVEPRATASVKAEPHTVVNLKPMEIKIAEASKKATDANATIPVKKIPQTVIVNGKRKGIVIVEGKPYNPKTGAEPAKATEKPKATAEPQKQPAEKEQ